MTTPTPTTPKQRTRAWVAAATPQQTADALHNGELDQVLKGHDPADEPDAPDTPDEATEQPDEQPDEQVTAQQLATMTAPEIVLALSAGRLHNLLTGKPPTPAPDPNKPPADPNKPPADPGKPSTPPADTPPEN